MKSIQISGGGARSPLRQFLAFWSPDRLGTYVSAACVVHCILTPVLLSLSAAWAHLLPGEERIHRSLAVLVALLGGAAFISGYRKHRKRRVALSMAAGLALIFSAAIWGDRLPSHYAEIAWTLCGSCFMIAAHRMNHTFCNACTRCDPD